MARFASMRGALTVLGKWPVPGRVKTRLATTIGADEAAAWARAFLMDAVVSLSGFDRPIFVALEGAPAGVSSEPFLTGCEVVAQPTGSLGDRMLAVLSLATRRGAPWALVLGADIVGLPAPHVEAAIEVLERPDGPDVVLGPTTDGGYYLLGVRSGREDSVRVALSAVRFGTEHALSDTHTSLVAKGHEVALTPSFFDVDVPSDLARLVEHLDAHPECIAPATRARLLSVRTTGALPW